MLSCFKQIPKGCNNLHHEAELGVIISKKGSNISESEAMEYVGGYTIVLDMTARDWQQEAISKGLPWSMAKGFDTACPVGDFIPKEQVKDVNNLSIWCKVNQQLRQDGNTEEMIFKIPYLISYASSFFTLEKGDLILTGTPEGTGSVKNRDVIEAGLDNIVKVKFDIVSK